LSLMHAQNGAVQVNILAARQFGMKAGPNFQKAAHPASDFDITLRWIRNTRDDFQQRALSGAVRTDQGYGFALCDVEAHIFDSPERVLFASSLPSDSLGLPGIFQLSAQSLPEARVHLSAFAEAVTFGNSVDFNSRLHVLSLDHIREGTFHPMEHKQPRDEEQRR